MQVEKSKHSAICRIVLSIRSIAVLHKLHTYCIIQQHHWSVTVSVNRLQSWAKSNRDSNRDMMAFVIRFELLEIRFEDLVIRFDLKFYAIRFDYTAI